MPAARDAQVPPPYGVLSVSPVMTRTRSIGTPNDEATHCAMTDSAPWPCSVTPEWQNTAPVASSLMVTPSCAEIFAPPTP